MNTNDANEQLTWVVLQNALGQCSLWPACRPAPAGWTEVGPEGDVETCSAWVDVHWKNLLAASA